MGRGQGPGGARVATMISEPPPRPPASPDTIIALRLGRWLVWFTYIFFVFAVILLLLAFVLQATGANQGASFVDWAYRSADRLNQPFRSIYPSIVHGNGSIIDFAMLFGVVFYGLVAIVVHAIVAWLDRRVAYLDPTGPPA
jgi:uncharacterized protein YggT (Ycf19 family)